MIKEMGVSLPCYQKNLPSKESVNKYQYIGKLQNYKDHSEGTEDF